MAASANGKSVIQALALFLVGIFLLQVAWQLCVPAFRGIDEIDHAYRAAEVVEGHVAPSRQYADDGRGLVVQVPESLVEAAESSCEALTYVGPDNCRPIGPPADGLVRIASAAAEYAPGYYAIVGWPSLLLDGEVALYSMRLISSLLSLSLLGLAAGIALSRGRTWLVAGLLICLTPTVLYSSIVVAPNGLAMAGGLLMWTSWLCVDPSRPRSSRGPLVAGAVGASATIAAHNTGFLWVPAAVVVFASIWWPWRHPAQGLRHVLFPAALIAVTAGLTLSWTLFSGANVPRGEAADDIRIASVAETLALPILWVFQTVFSAPRAGGFAHPTVYAICVGSIFAFCAVGLRHAGPKVRLAAAGIALWITAMPLLLTWVTQHLVGLAWQGRYSIPLSAGIVLLAAASLDARLPFRAPYAAAVAFATGVTAVLACISARANVAAEDATFLGPYWVAPVLCVVAAVSLWLSMAQLRTSSAEENGGVGDKTAVDGAGIAPSVQRRRRRP